MVSSLDARDRGVDSQNSASGGDGCGRQPVVAGKNPTTRADGINAPVRR